MRHGGTTIEARGDLVWIPGPSPWPWVALAAVLLAATVAASRLRAWRPALAALLVVLVALDVTHAVGAGLSTVGGTGANVGAILSGSYVSIVGWVAGTIGAVLLARRRDDGLVAGAFAGIFIALNGGVIDFADLSRSQLPFAWPEAIARLAIAASLGIGFGTLAAAALRLRPAPPPTETPIAE